jgi:hypothetical protein
VSCIATGKFLPNRMGLLFLQGLEETIGRDARQAICRAADPERRWPDPPPDNLEKRLDFCFYTAVCTTLTDLYGERAAQRALFSASRSAFHRLLQGVSTLGGMEDPLLPWHSSEERVGHCLSAMGRVIQMLTDMEWIVLPPAEGRQLALSSCPECLNRTGTGVLCYGMTGMIRGMLDWAGAEERWRVTETACMAGGADRCTFRIDAVA